MTHLRTSSQITSDSSLKTPIPPPQNPGAGNTAPCEPPPHAPHRNPERPGDANLLGGLTV